MPEVDVVSDYGCDEEMFSKLGLNAAGEIGPALVHFWFREGQEATAVDIDQQEVLLATLPVAD